MTENLTSVLNTINENVDGVLVNLANHPEVRDCFKVPSLVNAQDERFSFRFYKFDTPVSAIREVVTYTYLLHGMNDGLLQVNKETLLQAAMAMRKSPIVEYSFLSLFHRLAARMYKEEGNEKKARLHEISFQIAEVKNYLLDLHYTDYLSPEDEERMQSPHLKEVLNLFHSDTLRYQALLLYIVRYVTTVLKVKPTLFLRPQYLLVEEALTIALELFASDDHCDEDLRACFYYYRSLYYALTCREGLADKYKEFYLALGGERDYEALCISLLEKLPALHWLEKEFVDYVMNFNANYEGATDWELYDIYELDDEMPLTGLYREQLLNREFSLRYIEAEKGNEEAIREVARCYREGDGVAVCVAAADAWERKLMNS